MDGSLTQASAAGKPADYFRFARELQELPEIDRAALLMWALDGMAYEEISHALGISLASAKVKI